ncbi:aspartate:alanine exchanger (AAE) family transporter [Dehalogenimonas lykanthroporepellens BL-DC-9]|nr:aspartate:alanine exchanger (AAE) family transporter [Dehalogenimonas lykanthroporepellens BL-DC-9]
MIMRSIGLGLILASVVTIGAGIVIGDGLVFYISGIALGLIGNILNWFGKRQIEQHK